MYVKCVLFIFYRVHTTQSISILSFRTWILLTSDVEFMFDYTTLLSLKFQLDSFDSTSPRGLDTSNIDNGTGRDLCCLINKRNIDNRIQV